MADHPAYRPITQEISTETHLSGVEIATGEQLFTEIDSDAAQRILSQTEIHGHPRHGEMLTPQKLWYSHLEPKYQVELGDTEINFSRPYDIGNGRIALVGFLRNDENNYVARSYYLSNSQGVWRYLPSYQVDGKDRVSWYSKGYDEISINLPFRAQAALASISKLELLQVDGSKDIFVGTARGRNIMDTYKREVARGAHVLQGNFYSHRRVPPEEIKFYDAGEAPDFSEVKLSWTQHSKMYGEITAEVFASRDGVHSYLLYRNDRGQCWVGGVEIKSNGTSMGVNEQWVDAGILTTPLLEYESQADGYGVGSYGHYTNMWENYLSKVPVIQEYIASLERRKEPAAAEAAPSLPEVLPVDVLDAAYAQLNEYQKTMVDQANALRRQGMPENEIRAQLAQEVARGLLADLPDGLRNFRTMKELARLLNLSAVEFDVATQDWAGGTPEPIDVAKPAQDSDLEQRMRAEIEWPRGEQAPEFWAQKAVEFTEVRQAYARIMVTAYQSGELTNDDLRHSVDATITKLGSSHELVRLGILMEDLVAYILEHNPGLESVNPDRVFARITQQVINDVAELDPILADRLEGPPADRI